MAHMLRKVMATMSEKGIEAYKEDIVRQLNIYTTDQNLPDAARIEMQRTVTEILVKADFEYRHGAPPE